MYSQTYNGFIPFLKEIRVHPYLRVVHITIFIYVFIWPCNYSSINVKNTPFLEIKIRPRLLRNSR